jgi:hypothetical protein
VRAGKANGVTASAPGEKRFFFGCRRDDRELAARSGVDVVIVQTLGDEHKVRNAEVDGESNHRWDEIGPDSSWNEVNITT